MKKNYDVIILGGGFVGSIISDGLSCSHLVIEKSDRLYGHCKSVVNGGFTYDLGGPHIIFSHNDYVMQEFKSRLSFDYSENERDVYINVHDMIEFPYENGIANASLDIRKKFITGVVESRINKKNPYQGLKSFFYSNFGKFACENYFFPYNDKIWKYDLNKIDTGWTKGRVQTLELTSLISSALGEYTTGMKHQAKFGYPKTGGIQRLAECYKPKGDVIFNQTVKKIRKYNEVFELKLSDGQVVTTRNVISTIPPSDLISAVGDTPADVDEALRKLEFNKHVNIFIGWQSLGEDLPLAIYNPSDKDLFHRITFTNRLSKNMCPEGCEGAMIEMTIPSNKTLSLDSSWMVEEAWKLIKSLVNIDSPSFLVSDVHVSDYAYIINTVENQKSRKIVLDYIKSLDIVSTGRLGGFEYINMDVAWQKAVEVLDAINS